MERHCTHDGRGRAALLRFPSGLRVRGNRCALLNPAVLGRAHKAAKPSEIPITYTIPYSVIEPSAQGLPQPCKSCIAIKLGVTLQLHQVEGLFK